MLDDVADFLLFLENYGKDLFATPSGHFTSGAVHEKYLLWCPKCKAARRVDVRAHWWTGGKLHIIPDPQGRDGYWRASAQPPDGPQQVRERAIPSVYAIACRQCETAFTALLYWGPNDQPMLAVFPRCNETRGTPHTPGAVAYYLDQAVRSQAAGANTAAVAMYRAALEHALYQQGYKDRMLGPKIAALEEDIKHNRGAAWLREIRPADLTLLTKLGNAVIHPNDREADAQKVLDGELLGQLGGFFLGFLDIIYEMEAERTAARRLMDEALRTMDPAKT